jgi:hypothetical protein
MKAVYRANVNTVGILAAYALFGYHIRHDRAPVVLAKAASANTNNVVSIMQARQRSCQVVCKVF